eukprot:CAMPEP_0179286890 /NCGR_PEP_ID=MMETSP0797-20121207/39981_1 /TAXON_ID=47934 /ORGANISM="Dinophysis acuminata, Strain DAEP01" /LENGTH=270 /DNA_ID=CAMNT_0020995801 /DNA_START=70 /DNA_END=880 /DNA_ORIENTATION=-
MAILSPPGARAMPLTAAAAVGGGLDGAHVVVDLDDRVHIRTHRDARVGQEKLPRAVHAEADAAEGRDEHADGVALPEGEAPIQLPPVGDPGARGRRPGAGELLPGRPPAVPARPGPDPVLARGAPGGRAALAGGVELAARADAPGLGHVRGGLRHGAHGRDLLRPRGGEAEHQALVPVADLPPAQPPPGGGVARAARGDEGVDLARAALVVPGREEALHHDLEVVALGEHPHRPVGDDEAVGVEGVVPRAAHDRRAPLREQELRRAHDLV